MLTKLLNLLNEGGTRRVSDLAEELGTTPKLVELMLEDLERMGLLKPVASDCSGRCEGCPMAGTCAVGAPAYGGSRGRMWVLTGDHGTASPGST